MIEAASAVFGLNLVEDSRFGMDTGGEQNTMPRYRITYCSETTGKLRTRCVIAVGKADAQSFAEEHRGLREILVGVERIPDAEPYQPPERRAVKGRKQARA